MSRGRFGRYGGPCWLAASAGLVACGGDEGARVLVYVDTDVPREFVDRVQVEVASWNHEEAGGAASAIAWDPPCEYQISSDAPQPLRDAPCGGTGRLPFSFELDPPALGRDDPALDVLLRVQAFKAGSAPSPAASAIDLPGSGAPPPNEPGSPLRRVCDVENLVLSNRSPNITVTSVAGRPNREGWSCAGAPAPERLVPIQLRPHGAGLYVVSTDAEASIFGVVGCGSSDVELACGQTALRLELGERNWSAGNIVVLVGQKPNQTHTVKLDAQVRVGREPQTGVAEPPASGAPDRELEPNAPDSGGIERLAWVRMDGYGGSISLTLSAGCLGVPADIAAQSSCVDFGKAVTIFPMDLEPWGMQRRKLPEWGLAVFHGCNDTAPEGPACIPGNVFLQGDPSQQRRIVRVDPFSIDKREFSVADYRKTVGDSSRVAFAPAPPDDPALIESGCAGAQAADDLPLTCVSWDTARVLCQLRGGDLPMSAQWEYVAAAAQNVGQIRGDERRFPWGASPGGLPQPQAGPAPAGNIVMRGELRDCVPGFDVCGLGSNVREWTAQGSPAGGGAEPKAQASGCGDDRKIVKGASFRDTNEVFAQVFSERPVCAPSRAEDLGFRCAYSVASGSVR